LEVKLLCTELQIAKQVQDRVLLKSVRTKSYYN